MPAQQSGWFRFSVRTLLAAVTIVGILLFLMLPKDWNKALHEAAAPADRVVVKSLEGWLDPIPEPVEITGKQLVQELVANIQINSYDSGSACGCHGDTELHFYSGKEHLFTLSHHHGTSLRWINGPWDGDGALTAKSRAALPEWFARHGYDGFVRLQALHKAEAN